MIRHDGRKLNELRNIKVIKNYLKPAEGSCLIEFGNTKVICTASLEEGVPPFLKGKGTGWVTAEYGMLPRSCNSRIKRNASSGRSQEIQRLVGRALRSAINLDKLGERTIFIDCDVIQGDGGTRTASITGGFIALALACDKLIKEQLITEMPITDFVAAISVGIYQDNFILDLDYEEDSNAQVDMNIVMLGSGKFVEVQGTAEKGSFSQQDTNKLLDLAKKGINDLIKIQKQSIKGIKI